MAADGDKGRGKGRTTAGRRTSAETLALVDRLSDRRAERSVERTTGAPARPRTGLDTPLESRSRLSLPTVSVDVETFGRWSERFARFMGTAWFIVGMTVFVVLWLVWNTVGPQNLQFDPRSLNYTLLTLILSLQASYAAPLILLAQNRQADRDRVSFEQDRQRAERGLADTEYLAREVAALRIALRDVATRDYLRSELRDLLDELRSEIVAGQDAQDGEPPAVAAGRDGAARQKRQRRSTRTTELPKHAP